MKITLFLATIVSCTIWASSTLADDSFILTGSEPQHTQKVARPIIPGQKVLKQQINALFNDPENPVSGNPNGKITLVEFFDYRCLHSIKMNSIINSLINHNSELRVVYKVLPKFGDVSLYAAKVALAANLQGKYNQMHNALMIPEKNVDKNKILEIAKSQGLDMNKLKNDINSAEIIRTIQHNQQLCRKLGINAVPLLFIGKTALSKNPSSGTIVYALGEVSEKQIQNLINNR